jgi:iron complex outermembrane receptor protein
MNITNVFSLTNDIDLTVSVFGRNLMDEIARNHSSFVKEDVPLPGRSYGLKFYATF